MDPPMEIAKAAFEIIRISVPSHFVDARRRAPL
jgi:hypothetical protein